MSHRAPKSSAELAKVLGEEWKPATHHAAMAVTRDDRVGVRLIDARPEALLWTVAIDAATPRAAVRALVRELRRQADALERSLER